MSNLGKLTELARIERVLPKRGMHFQDLVLVECVPQERPLGSARVQPGRKVLLHDIELTMTVEEAHTLFAAFGGNKDGRADT